jgi:hypothetical protein
MLIPLGGMSNTKVLANGCTVHTLVYSVCDRVVVIYWLNMQPTVSKNIGDGITSAFASSVGFYTDCTCEKYHITTPDVLINLI